MYLKSCKEVQIHTNSSLHCSVLSKQKICIEMTEMLQMRERWK